MMRMPTRLNYGEGRVDREVIDKCTCPIRRGNGHGTFGKVERVTGEAYSGRGVAALNARFGLAAWCGSRTGS